METYPIDTKDDAHVLIGADNPYKMRRRIRKGKNLQNMLEIEDIILNREGADLALVKVKENIDIERFTPICLPQKGPDFTYLLNTTQKKMGYVAGWGRNEKGSGPKNQLEELLVRFEKCSCLSVQKNKRNWFCFRGVLPGESASEGDAGGPVMVDEPGIGWTLAGIISGGTEDDCNDGKYGLAVDVYYWINWITFFAYDGEYCKVEL